MGGGVVVVVPKLMTVTLLLITFATYSLPVTLLTAAAAGPRAFPSVSVFVTVFVLPSITVTLLLLKLGTKICPDASAAIGRTGSVPTGTVEVAFVLPSMTVTVLSELET